MTEVEKIKIHIKKVEHNQRVNKTLKWLFGLIALLGLAPILLPRPIDAVGINFLFILFCYPMFRERFELRDREKQVLKKTSGVFANVRVHICEILPTTSKRLSQRTVVFRISSRMPEFFVDESEFTLPETKSRKEQVFMIYLSDLAHANIYPYVDDLPDIYFDIFGDSMPAFLSEKYLKELPNK